MAKRRTFAVSITETGRFLMMPATAQNLYFHLVLRADNEGIVDAYGIMNMVKASDDDLIILERSEYITILTDDYLIKIVERDWKEHVGTKRK